MGWDGIIKYVDVAVSLDCVCLNASRLFSFFPLLPPPSLLPLSPPSLMLNENLRYSFHISIRDLSVSFYHSPSIRLLIINIEFDYSSPPFSCTSLSFLPSSFLPSSTPSFLPSSFLPSSLIPTPPYLSLFPFFLPSLPPSFVPFFPPSLPPSFHHPFHHSPLFPSPLLPIPSYLYLPYILAGAYLPREWRCSEGRDFGTDSLRWEISQLSLSDCATFLVSNLLIFIFTHWHSLFLCAFYSCFIFLFLYLYSFISLSFLSHSTPIHFQSNSQYNNWSNYDTYMSGGYLSDLWIYTKQLDFDTPLGTDYRTSDGTAPHCQSFQFNHPTLTLILSSSLVSFNTTQMSSTRVILQAFFLAFLNFLFFYDAVIDSFLSVS